MNNALLDLSKPSFSLNHGQATTALHNVCVMLYCELVAGIYTIELESMLMYRIATMYHAQDIEGN